MGVIFENQVRNGLLALISGANLIEEGVYTLKENQKAGLKKLAQLISFVISIQLELKSEILGLAFEFTDRGFQILASKGTKNYELKGRDAKNCVRFLKLLQLLEVRAGGSQ